VADSSGNLVEVRRLDGQLFEAWEGLSERKSHTIKGSKKSWPVGILEAKDYPMIVMTEGVPDFLAAFQVIMTENAIDRVAPVSMLSASTSICDEALPFFIEKHVRIIPHLDEPGFNAGEKWAEQLKAAGALKVDFVRLDVVAQEEDQKDLCDILALYKDGMTYDSKKWSLLQ
jgi:hypothetical protein